MPRNAAPWYRKARQMFYGNVDGKQTPLGITDPADLAGAWAALETLKKLAEKASGEPASPAPSVTIRDAVRAFIEDRTPEVKPDTLKGYARTLKPLVARFGTVRVNDVIPGQVEADAAGRGWSNTTRANYLCTVRQCLAFAGRKVKFRRPEKESRGAEAVIPGPVHEKVLLVTRGDWRAVIQFLWLTGCRPSEAAGLVTSAVDWPTGVVMVRDHKTRRHGKQRHLFLCPEAVALLKAQREKHGEGLLFRGKGGKPFSRQAFTMKFGRISERIGHKVTSYGYRHTFATRALTSGVPDATVAALLGHAGTTMLHRHYSHICSQARHLRDAATKLNAKPEPPAAA
jgi:integrase